APFCVDCEASQRTHRQVLATRWEKIAFGRCTMRVCVRAIKPQCAGDKTKRRGFCRPIPGGPALADSDRTKGCQRRGERKSQRSCSSFMFDNNCAASWRAFSFVFQSSPTLRSEERRVGKEC